MLVISVFKKSKQASSSDGAFSLESESEKKYLSMGLLYHEAGWREVEELEFVHIKNNTKHNTSIKTLSRQYYTI